MAADGTHNPSQLCTPLTNPRVTGPGAPTSVGRWRRFAAAIPLRFALLATAAVWAMGCVWSFREQSLFAQVKGFHLPWLLPTVIDGLAIALACVAYAASLDGRPGVVARLGTAVAVAPSAASNATFAWQRSGDPTTVVIAAGVPVAANLAFEVLLHELRRQVLRRRGLPAPAAVPYPRLIRVVLAPCSTLRQWRRLVLDLTALPSAIHATDTAASVASADAFALASGVSAGPPVSSSDAPAPLVAVGALAPTGASHTPADASAAAQTAARLASADTVTALRATVTANADARQLIQTDARQDDADAGSDADTPPDADAGSDADARSDASGEADAGASPRRLRATDAPARIGAADAGALAQEARQLYRASVAAGDPLTGRQLGGRYHRSPSWGRERIGEVKSLDALNAKQTHRDGDHPTGPAGRPLSHTDHHGAARRAVHAA